MRRNSQSINMCRHRQQTSQNSCFDPEWGNDPGVLHDTSRTSTSFLPIQIKSFVVNKTKKRNNLFYNFTYFETELGGRCERTNERKTKLDPYFLSSFFLFFLLNQLVIEYPLRGHGGLVVALEKKCHFPLKKLLLLLLLLSK